MSKVFWKGSVLLAPVPAALITCGTMEKSNIITIGWTGIINTHPPITYISVRPDRYSHDIIKENGEFAINLTTSAMCRKTDFCGVKSGRDTDKFKACDFHKIKGRVISAPIIEECPVSLECKVINLISHSLL